MTHMVMVAIAIFLCPSSVVDLTFVRPS